MPAPAPRSRGRRPPPFGRELASAKRDGVPVNPWLLAGRDAWRLARRRGPGRLVLPHGEDPTRYDWRCLAGEAVVVRWPGASASEVDSLGALLIRSGVRVALVLDDMTPDRETGRYEVLRPFRRYIRGVA